MLDAPEINAVREYPPCRAAASVDALEISAVRENPMCRVADWLEFP